MAKKKDQTVNIEDVKNESENTSTPATPVVSEAQREDSIFKAGDFEPNLPPKKDTPEVDIVNTNGTVLAVQRKAIDAVEPRGDEAPAELAKLAEKEVGADPEIAELEKEVARLREEVAAKGDEIIRLNREILESPAERFRAELEVSRREYEILLGDQQAKVPARQIFG